MAIAITTTDNPFNPLNDFDNWFQFDSEKGYSTINYLGRIARTSNQLSDPENEEEIERAIDEIIKYGTPIDKWGNHDQKYVKIKE